MWWMCRESVREEIMMNKWTDDCRLSLRLKGKSELINLCSCGLYPVVWKDE